MITALAVACGLGVVLGAPVGMVSFAASMFEMPKDTLRMAVNVEIWQKDIVENLFKNNEFIMNSIDESQYVLAGSVVHIPQAGAPSKAERNRANLPATITNRKDTDVTYALDEITTDPRFIPDADKSELSYDKRMSCIEEDLAAIKEVAANAMLYRWAPTYYIKTSSSTAYTAHYGTTTRKGVCWDDFKAAKKIF